MESITEGTINIISEGTRLDGKIQFDHLSRVHGILVGEVAAGSGTTLILAETALVEGTIDADTLVVDGFVRGDIRAKTKVILSGTARVIGNIQTPSLTIEFGAFFEGKTVMENLSNGGGKPLTSSPSLKPA